MKTQLKLSSAPMSAMISINNLDVISFEKQGYESFPLEKWEDLHSIVSQDQIKLINRWFSQYTHKRSQKNGRAIVIYKTILLGEKESMSKTLYVNILRKGNDVKIICENILPIKPVEPGKVWGTIKKTPYITKRMHTVRVAAVRFYEKETIRNSREMGEVIKIDLLKEVQLNQYCTFVTDQYSINYKNNVLNA